MLRLTKIAYIHRIWIVNVMVELHSSELVSHLILCNHVLLYKTVVIIISNYGDSGIIRINQALEKGERMLSNSFWSYSVCHLASVALYILISFCRNFDLISRICKNHHVSSRKMLREIQKFWPCSSWALNLKKMF